MARSESNPDGRHGRRKRGGRKSKGAESNVIEKLSVEDKLRVYEEVRALLEAHSAGAHKKDSESDSEVESDRVEKKRGRRSDRKKASSDTPPGIDRDEAHWNSGHGEPKPKSKSKGKAGKKSGDSPKKRNRAPADKKNVKSDSDKIVSFSHDQTYVLDALREGEGPAAKKEPAPRTKSSKKSRNEDERGRRSLRGSQKKKGRKPGRPKTTRALPPQSRSKSGRILLTTGVDEASLIAITESGRFHDFPAGQPIYRQGDPGGAAFWVIEGKVEVKREVPGKELLLYKARPGEMLGEVDELCASKYRSCSAYTTRPTTLLELPTDLVTTFTRGLERRPTRRLLRNALCLLARRLREAGISDYVDAVTDSSGTSTGFVSLDDTRNFLAQYVEGPAVEELMELEMITPETFDTGDFIYEAGEKPDGFFLIQSGKVEVSNDRSDTESVRMKQLPAPCVVGEVSYFSNRRRTLSVRATEQTQAFHFLGRPYRSLRKKDPDHALHVLASTVKLAAGLVHACETQGPM